jgi:hypothetical protein
MVKTVFTAVVAMLLSTFLVSARAGEPDHDAWDALLKNYVSESEDGVNRVAFARWKGASADRAALDRYIRDLAAAKPSTLSRNEAFAYWANLYNAITVDVVLDAYPVTSIRDIKSKGAGLFDFKAATGPWREKRVTVEGRALSLDDIEHEIMRPTFKDPRVHYAVNCASIGCPDLRREAFVGARLNDQLDAAARDYVAHPRGVRIAGDGMRLSSIYRWFASDFGSAAQLRAHLIRYAPGEKAAQIRAATRITGYDYDWALNDASRR